MKCFYFLFQTFLYFLLISDEIYTDMHVRKRGSAARYTAFSNVDEGE